MSAAYDGVGFWDRFAPSYDRFMRHVRRGYGGLTARVRAAVWPEADVVELATGTGLIALAIAPLVRSVIGIDLSEAMVAIARGKAASVGAANATFRVRDGASTGLPDESADVVIACNVLHVMPDPERLVREMLRLAKPGGLIVVASYCHGQNLLTRCVSYLLGLKGFEARQKWSIQGLRTFLAENGLVITSEAMIPGVVPMLYVQGHA